MVNIYDKAGRFIIAGTIYQIPPDASPSKRVMLKSNENAKK